MVLLHALYVSIHVRLVIMVLKLIVLVVHLLIFELYLIHHVHAISDTLIQWLLYVASVFIAVMHARIFKTTAYPALKELKDNLLITNVLALIYTLTMVFPFVKNAISPA